LVYARDADTIEAFIAQLDPVTTHLLTLNCANLLTVDARLTLNAGSPLDTGGPLLAFDALLALNALLTFNGRGPFGPLGDALLTLDTLRTFDTGRAFGTLDLCPLNAWSALHTLNLLRPLGARSALALYPLRTLLSTVGLLGARAIAAVALSTGRGRDCQRGDAGG